MDFSWGNSPSLTRNSMTAPCLIVWNPWSRLFSVYSKQKQNFSESMTRTWLWKKRRCTYILWRISWRFPCCFWYRASVKNVEVTTHCSLLIERPNKKRNTMLSKWMPCLYWVKNYYRKPFFAKKWLLLGFLLSKGQTVDLRSILREDMLAKELSLKELANALSGVL